jgi:UDP-N-acetylglucosamine 3-dehydrogenase
VTAPLRVGLAGLGVMGRNHLRHLSAREECVLAAVSDPDSELVDQAVQRTAAAGFGSAIAMINEAELDAVVIAAPTTVHAELVSEALSRDLPVLVEKPLAATVAEGLSLVTMARSRDVPLQVGHVERFNPAVLELGRRVEKGWLGRVFAITSRRAGPFPERIRDVGVTIDLATHDADILSWVVGERPTRVYAETAQRVHATNEDLLFGLLSFPSGATGMLDVNWLTPAKRRQLAVVGEAGMFELDYLTQRLTFTSADVGHPTVIDGYATTFEGNVVDIDVTHREPLAAELDAFLAVARSGGRPVVDGEDGLWALEIASKLLEAATTGRPMDLGDLALQLRRGDH